ncbi:RICIN domain-containing protein [Streptomyces sp. NPDC048255]|uniref:RICIN domain-containing protein n=1 Tax=Streptomyces sp. NPDC048255 TaxID=3154713 RepID=UPI0033D19DB4
MQLRPHHALSKCLDVAGKSIADAANVFQWTCLPDPADNQRWYFTDGTVTTEGVYYYNIRAKHSGKCLDVEDKGTKDATNVFQWTCLGMTAQNQRWSIWVFV